MSQRSSVTSRLYYFHKDNIKNVIFNKQVSVFKGNCGVKFKLLFQLIYFIDLFHELN